MTLKLKDQTQSIELNELLTDLIKKEVALKVAKDIQNDFYKALGKVIGIFGYDYYFKLKDSDTVYKTVESKGRFVSFERNSYARTKHGDEKKGSLSRKEADQVITDGNYCEVDPC